MKKNKKSQKGFTLIELILFMGLFSIILLVLTTLFGEIVQKQLELQSMSDVESDGAYIFSRLEYDIARADNVVFPVSSGETQSSLVLDMNGTDYTYEIVGNKLQLTAGAEIFDLNNPRTQISGLTFQRLGNPGGTPSVKVGLTVGSLTQEASDQRSTQIESSFGLRQ